MNKRKILTIPNALSLLRLLMIPLFVWTYTVKQDSLLTALVLALSGLTDLLDGQIARRFNMVSDLGKALDPVADKLTQGVMLICLLRRFPVMWAPLALLVVRDTFVGATNLMIIHETGQVKGADMHGKVATCCLDGLMLLHLIFIGIPTWLSIALTVLASLVMLISFWLYAVRNIGQLRKARRRAAEANPEKPAGKGLNTSVVVMATLLAASIALFVLSCNGALDALPTLLYVFLRMASLVGMIGIPAFFIGEAVPRSLYDPYHFPFKTLSWEKDGRVYERLGVKFRKQHAIDMSKFMKGAFPKQNTLTRDPAHLRRLIQEMCNAELVHWILTLFSPLFAVLIDGWYGIVIAVFYAYFNLSDVMIQRYNRPRILMILERLEK